VPARTNDSIGWILWRIVKHRCCAHRDEKPILGPIKVQVVELAHPVSRVSSATSVLLLRVPCRLVGSHAPHRRRQQLIHPMNRRLLLRGDIARRGYGGRHLRLAPQLSMAIVILPLQCRRLGLEFLDYVVLTPDNVVVRVHATCWLVGSPSHAISKRYSSSASSLRQAAVEKYHAVVSEQITRKPRRTRRRSWGAFIDDCPSVEISTVQIFFFFFPRSRRFNFFF